MACFKAAVRSSCRRIKPLWQPLICKCRVIIAIHEHLRRNVIKLFFLLHIRILIWEVRKDRHETRHKRYGDTIWRASFTPPSGFEWNCIASSRQWYPKFQPAAEEAALLPSTFVVPHDVCRQKLTFSADESSSSAPTPSVILRSYCNWSNLQVTQKTAPSYSH